MIKTRMKNPPTQSQINLANRLKRLRLKLDLSLQEVADKIGISKVTLLRYETLDITNIPSNNIEKLASIYKTTPSYIMGWDDDKEVKFSMSIPILGPVACGQPIEAIEDLEWIDVDEKCDYGLIAKGDSMIGVGVYDGDLILLDKTQHLNNGEIGAVCVGDDITLKKFYYYPEKRRIILKAANPDYEDMIFIGDDELEEIRVIGKAKLLTRKY